MSMSDGVIKTIITLDEDQFSGRYSNAAKVDIIKKNGTISTKYVDVGALVQALLDSKKGEIQYHRIGALPQGFYYGMIRVKSVERFLSPLQNVKRLSCLKIPGMRLAARRFCLALR